jgi:hypothetical protein
VTGTACMTYAMAKQHLHLKGYAIAEAAWHRSLSNAVMAGRVPAISTRAELTKDAVPVSQHSMEMAGSSPAMTRLAAHAVRQQHGLLV